MSQDETSKKNRRPRRKESDTIKENLVALRYLYTYGPLYKSDFIKLLSPQDSKTYNRLSRYIEKAQGVTGFIERKIKPEDWKRTADQMTTVVALNKAGGEFYTKLEKHIGEIDPKCLVRNNVSISTKQLDRILYPHLKRQKAMIMYMLAGVPCFAHEKPSLLYLAYHLGADNDFKGDPCNPYYADPYVEEVARKNPADPEKEKAPREIMKARETLLNTYLNKTGAFYSVDEVVDFFKTIKGDPSYTDSFKGVAWHGLYLSEKTMLVNFVLKLGYNSRAYIYSEPLRTLLHKLAIDLGPATSVIDRKIYYLTDENGGQYENAIDAVTIGIGSSHVYSEAMGNKAGLIKEGRDMARMASEKEEKKKKDDKKEQEAFPKAKDFLDCTSVRFKRIYSIDDKQDGIEMLHYIVTKPLEQYVEESESLFSADKRFVPSKESSIFKATYGKDEIPAVYLPVYEIKTLRYLSQVGKGEKRQFPLLVACRKSMMETVAHCLHRDCISYQGQDREYPGLYFVELFNDGDDKPRLGKIYDEKAGVFNIYDSDGYIKGKRLIDEYLKTGGRKLKGEADYALLARSIMAPLDRDESDTSLKSRFYAAVARSKPEKRNELLNKAIEASGARIEIFDKDRQLEKTGKRSYVSLSVYFRKEDLKMIDKLMDEIGSNRSAFLRRLAVTSAARILELSDQEGITRREAYQRVIEMMALKTPNNDNMEI
ncbi:MAG: hypothetical protein IJI83_03010 [Oscillospiraceae bacterium]|nr:hypothetical protein [Oscillospiraceae bacterium]